MVVAALRLTFMVPPDGASTKSIAQKIKERLWTNFKAATAEVHSPTTAELMIGVSIVGSQEKLVQQRVQEIIKNLQEWPSVELTYDESEIIHFDDLEIERDFVKYDP